MSDTSISPSFKTSDSEETDYSLVSDEQDLQSIPEPEPDSLLPPPEASFPTIEELRTSVTTWTRRFGYDLVIASSAKNGKKTVRCGRAGKTKNTRGLRDEDRIRRTASSKSNCPMLLYYVPNEAGWTIRYAQGDKSFVHNHERVVEGQGTAIQRRSERTDEIRELVQQHLSSGIAPKQTLATIKTKYPDTLQTRKDIANMKARVRAITLSLMTVAEATLLRLERADFFSQHVLDEERRIHRLFFAYNESVSLLRRFHRILLFDCTYKTNKYRKPILNICGVTGSNRTIQVAVCLLPGETESDFLWAFQQLDLLLRQERIPHPLLVVTDRDRAQISALRQIFVESHLRLCSWHMNKDVQAYTRRHLGKEVGSGSFVDNELVDSFLRLYREVCSARSEADFRKGCHSLKTKWLQGWEYLYKHWFKDFSQYCVAFGVDERLHFGIQSTSRVEGSHSTMKKWLQSSRLDVLSLIERLIPWWQNISHEVRSHVSNEEERGLISCNHKFLVRTQRKIWKYALYRIEDQIRGGNEEFEELTRFKRTEKSVCSGIFTRSTGLPCKHLIRDLKLEDSSLEPSHFHPHWRIIFVKDEYIEPPKPTIHEPSTIPKPSQVTRSKRRAKQTGTGEFGTRREPLLSERIDATCSATPIQRIQPIVVQNQVVLPPSSSFVPNSQNVYQPVSFVHNVQLESRLPQYPFPQPTYSSQTSYSVPPSAWPPQQPVYSSQTNGPIPPPPTWPLQQPVYSSQTNSLAPPPVWPPQQPVYSSQTNGPALPPAWPPQQPVRSSQTNAPAPPPAWPSQQPIYSSQTSGPVLPPSYAPQQPVYSSQTNESRTYWPARASTYAAHTSFETSSRFTTGS
jgi:hypothetical protein